MASLVAVGRLTRCSMGGVGMWLAVPYLVSSVVAGGCVVARLGQGWIASWLERGRRGILRYVYFVAIRVAAHSI